jgi:hypothetical protein
MVRIAIKRARHMALIPYTVSSNKITNDFWDKKQNQI